MELPIGKNIIQDSSLMFWYDPTHSGGIVSNTITDLSGRGQLLTWNSMPSIVEGCFSINGSQLATGVLLDYDIGDYTHTIWMKALYSNLQYPGIASQPLIFGGPVSSAITYFDFNDGCAMFFYFNSDGGKRSKLGVGKTGALNPFFDGQWHAYTIVRRSTGIPRWYHYIDGVLSSLDSSEDSPDGLLVPSSITTMSTMRFGNIFNYTGLLGANYAYKRALTDAEILANVSATKKNNSQFFPFFK